MTILIDEGQMASREDVAGLVGAVCVSLPPVSKPGERLDEILRVMKEQDENGTPVLQYYSIETDGAFTISSYVEWLQKRARWEKLQGQL